MQQTTRPFIRFDLPESVFTQARSFEMLLNIGEECGLVALGSHLGDN